MKTKPWTSEDDDLDRNSWLAPVRFDCQQGGPQQIWGQASSFYTWVDPWARESKTPQSGKLGLKAKGEMRSDLPALHWIDRRQFNFSLSAPTL
jgi:hypothetical protein